MCVLGFTECWAQARTLKCLAQGHSHERPSTSSEAQTQGIDVKSTALSPFPYKPWFLRVCSTNLLKMLWEKEKFLMTSYFVFSYSVFHPFRELSAIFMKSEIVVCKLCQFCRI